MSDIPVQFYRTPSSNLENVTITDGQVVVSTASSSADLYFDVDNTRLPLTSPNNGVLTIQKNSTNVATFSANQSSNITADISVPTKVSELTNDSGYTTNTGTVTKVSTGAGLTGGDVTTTGTIKAKLQSETQSSLTAATRTSTSGREYPVGLDASGNLSVNVPWSDTDTNTHRTIQMNGTQILGNNTTALNLVAGDGITLSNSSGSVTITNSGSGGGSTPNDGTLTISQNGTTVATFSANQSSDTTAALYTHNAYGTCTTAPATAEKSVTVSPSNFQIITGSRITVAFSYANTASAPTLSVTDATGVTRSSRMYTPPNEYMYRSIPNAATWVADDYITFLWSGSSWQMLDWFDHLYIPATVTLSTSATTTVTFENYFIDSDSVVELVSDISELTPISISVTADDTCTVVLPIWPTATTVNLRLYVKG